MRITFDGVVLADGESRTSYVATGLTPSGQLNFEPLEYLRAAWAVPKARGNRLLTLPVIIQFPPAASFGAALIESLMYFANLPDEGALVIQDGALSVTFSTAVCQRNVQLEEIYGLSNAVGLTFICGQPSNATLSLLAQMNSDNLINLYRLGLRVNGVAITKLNGGTTDALDALTTTDVDVGFAGWSFFTIGSDIQQMTLSLITDPDPGVTVENADPSAGPVIILPDDYNASTNPKIWVA